ncbi:hypothetical protein [Calothrix sp. NIES-3974]|uniref:hypothetical protein n=1 Tax=Calothrix sp. NIES-3974 TaxID=2005462 RepID=UPI0012FDBD96|nr:hypothetical protein [Calothrix sp. NIES-3974]
MSKDNYFLSPAASKIPQTITPRRKYADHFPSSHTPRGNHLVNEDGRPHALDNYVEHSYQTNGLDVSANLY